VIVVVLLIHHPGSLACHDDVMVKVPEQECFFCVPGERATKLNNGAVTTMNSNNEPGQHNIQKAGS